MPPVEPLVALSFTAVLGAAWGSFLNQLVSRTPGRVPEHTVGRATPPADPPPGVTPWRPARSLCFACWRCIAWYDNVPIVSYLWLRGRCRACGAPIGRRTLLLEVLTPLLLVTWHGALLWVAAAGRGWPGGEPLPGGLAPTLAWGGAVLSWLLVVGTLRVEGRRIGPAWWVGAAVLVATAAVRLGCLG